MLAALLEKTSFSFGLQGKDSTVHVASLVLLAMSREIGGCVPCKLLLLIGKISSGLGNPVILIYWRWMSAANGGIYIVAQVEIVLYKCILCYSGTFSILMGKSWRLKSSLSRNCGELSLLWYVGWSELLNFISAI